MQHVYSEPAGLLIAEDQARGVMLDDFSQASADGGEKVIQVQMGDHRVVHFQKKPHAVTFVCQLLLGGSSALVVQNVVNGDRDLPRHLPHEVDLRFLIG